MKLEGLAIDMLDQARYSRISVTMKGHFSDSSLWWVVQLGG